MTWKKRGNGPRGALGPLPEGTEQRDRDLVVPFAADQLAGVYVAVVKYLGREVDAIKRNLTVGEMAPVEKRNYTVGDTFKYVPKKPGVWVVFEPSSECRSSAEFSLAKHAFL